MENFFLNEHLNESMKATNEYELITEQELQGLHQTPGIHTRKHLAWHSF